MELTEYLNKNSLKIIDEASQALQRTSLKHYNNSTEEENRNRIHKLFELTLNSLSEKSLVSMLEYSEEIARTRFNSGFDFHEVHAAFNVLEETIWTNIIKDIKTEDLGNYLGLISTVLGAGKESLAITYITLAGKTKTPTLDLSELFSKAEGN